MLLEVMKWRNCTDVSSGTKLWDGNFLHAAIPVNYTSEFQELVEATGFFPWIVRFSRHYVSWLWFRS
jgi:hypothetical protein